MNITYSDTWISNSYTHDAPLTESNLLCNHNPDGTLCDVCTEIADVKAQNEIHCLSISRAAQDTSGPCPPTHQMGVCGGLQATLPRFRDATASAAIECCSRLMETPRVLDPIVVVDALN